MTLKTPYYLIDEKKLLRNLRIIKKVRDNSGAQSLLALKCFSSWGVFDLMSRYMDGTTSSSLYEARLGYEKFGGSTHAYSVAWNADEVKEVQKYADTCIFNSASQLKRFHHLVRAPHIGVRVNPMISYSHFDLADPARKYSRLGIANLQQLDEILPLINGCMFHFNCENADFANISRNLDSLAKTYATQLKQLEWISLGGGLFFTKEGFPVDRFCTKLKSFAKRFDLQIYLEPGEAAITQSTQLVTTVLDVVKNDKEIAIIDASTEAHMLDLLIYRLDAKIDGTVTRGGHEYIVAGRSCLAGDVFGTFRFPRQLKPGSTVRIADAAGYTMVKKNWFNGVPMPSIAVKRVSGKIELVRSYGYKHFLNGVS